MAAETTTMTFGRSAPPAPRTLEGIFDAPEDFQFKQVFLTKGPDGNPKQLVIPLTIKDPADGNIAVAARNRLLTNLAEGTKVISYVDIKNLTMTVRRDGKDVVEGIPFSEEVKTLRAVYGRLARANEIPVSWDSKSPQSFACPPGRLAAMNRWQADRMITKLEISDPDKKKRAREIEKLRSGMEMAIYHDEPRLSAADSGKRKQLRDLFAGCSRLGLVAKAGGVSKDQLKKAVEAESGERKGSFVQGTILRLTDDEITSDEKAYLEDIELLGVQERGALVTAYHALGRPAPHDDRFERVLLAAFDIVAEGKEVEEAVDVLFNHPLVAEIGLGAGDLAKYKEIFNRILQRNAAELL